MDYEKKYKDALNLAKSYYGNGCNEFLDTIFPELAESEDEKIRKAIIELLKEVGRDDTGISENAKCMIAYLEKQKESLHIPETCKENADSFTDGIIEVRSFQRGIEEGRRLEKQKEQKPAERPSWKPSKEQMDALSEAVSTFDGYEESDAIKSLYNQLNRLGVKEEPEYYQHFDSGC